MLQSKTQSSLMDKRIRLIYTLSTRDLHHNKKYTKIKGKGQKNIFHAHGKKDGIKILISENKEHNRSQRRSQECAKGINPTKHYKTFKHLCTPNKST